ncbi:MAG: 3-dehydroquinate synthase [Bacilli bacterium]|nr:3-dehydroquinate synthase [Bacilli bacterium]
MKTLRIPHLNGIVTIKCGENIVGEELKKLSLDHSLLIITDETIANLYAHTIFDIPTIIVPEGEKAKDIETYSMVIQEMLKRQVDKNVVLIALGGGSISDLTGFVANSYKRGLRFVNVPTTLLSQIDASIGGKNALNIQSLKNQIGTIYQPKEIIIDSSFLKTLPQKQFNSGMAEAIKYALLFDEALLEKIENQTFNQNDLIFRCVELKAQISSYDEFDSHKRKVLNFGHTVGHVLESLSKFTLTHGEAIAWGMLWEINSSLRPRLKKVLSKYSLLPDISFTLEEILSQIKSDKKIESENITLAKIPKVGKYELVKQTIETWQKELAHEHLW